MVVQNTARCGGGDACSVASCFVDETIAAGIGSGINDTCGCVGVSEVSEDDGHLLWTRLLDVAIRPGRGAGVVELPVAIEQR